MPSSHTTIQRVQRVHIKPDHQVTISCRVQLLRIEDHVNLCAITPQGKALASAEILRSDLHRIGLPHSFAIGHAAFLGLKFVGQTSPHFLRWSALKNLIASFCAKDTVNLHNLSARGNLFEPRGKRHCLSFGSTHHIGKKWSRCTVWLMDKDKKTKPYETLFYLFLQNPSVLCLKLNILTWVISWISWSFWLHSYTPPPCPFFCSAGARALLRGAHDAASA